MIKMRMMLPTMLFIVFPALVSASPARIKRSPGSGTTHRRRRHVTRRESVATVATHFRCEFDLFSALRTHLCFWIGSGRHANPFYAGNGLAAVIAAVRVGRD